MSDDMRRLLEEAIRRIQRPSGKGPRKMWLTAGVARHLGCRTVPPWVPDAQLLVIEDGEWSYAEVDGMLQRDMPKEGE
jgi:hypothetical protein